MHPANPRRWAALAVIALAQFMVIMDTSIIGVALPEIRSALGFGAEDLSWVFNAYVIAFGGLLLLGGRLSDLLGAKRVFAAGWLVLTVGSLAAGLADSTGVEIAGRAVQGAGAALIAPSALTLLMMLFGHNPKELMKAFAIYGAAAPAGGTAGVFLGGVITEWISWPWVFYVNVPIALLVLAVSPRLMPSAPARRGSLDLAGAFTATAGLAVTVFGIVRAPEEGWGSAATLVAIGGGLALLAGFVAIQSARREPLMRLSILRTPNLAPANLAQLLLGAAWIPRGFFL
jgi:MFS family permease